MKQLYDLSSLAWTVEGFIPNMWLFEWRFGLIFGASGRALMYRQCRRTCRARCRGRYAQRASCPTGTSV